MAKKQQFPFEFKDVELSDYVSEHLHYKQGDLVHVGPKGYILPTKYKQEASDIYNLELRSTDFFVSSLPRSGTTWTQELVWMVANDLDYKTSSAIPLEERYTYLEHGSLYQGERVDALVADSKNSDKTAIKNRFRRQGVVELLEATGPRFIKTHLPLSLLPSTVLDTSKVIYIARDPRDVVVSFFHLMKSYGYTGDFVSFWKLYTSDLWLFTPYFEHLKESWNNRNHPNMLFLFYEELKKDLGAAVRRVAHFLNKQYSDEQIQELCQHLTFDNFKNNKSLTYLADKELGIMGKGDFVRQGKSGGWRDVFDESMTKETAEWIKDNLKNSDFKYPHFDTETL